MHLRATLGKFESIHEFGSTFLDCKFLSLIRLIIIVLLVASRVEIVLILAAALVQSAIGCHTVLLSVLSFMSNSVSASLLQDWNNYSLGRLLLAALLFGSLLK